MTQIGGILHLNPNHQITYFVNSACSADGYIARVGERTEISSEADWRVVMEMRNHIDGIIVGSNTVMVDDPSLLTKEQYLDGKEVNHPVRIILDRSGRLDTSYKVFRTGESPVFWVTSKVSEVPEHVTVLSCSKHDTMGRIVEILNQALTPWIKSGFVMVEGGSRIIHQFIKNDIVERIRLYRAPMLLGSGVPLISDTIDKNLELLSVRELGGGVEEIWKLQ